MTLFRRYWTSFEKPPSWSAVIMEIAGERTAFGNTGSITSRLSKCLYCSAWSDDDRADELIWLASATVEIAKILRYSSTHSSTRLSGGVDRLIDTMSVFRGTAPVTGEVLLPKWFPFRLYLAPARPKWFQGYYPRVWRLYRPYKN